jgi:predicted amidohydrolase
MEECMTIRIAQVKVYPVKREMDANAARLASILDEIAPHKPDVVITPEGFLDGYVSTEEDLDSDGLRDFSVDPANSSYVKSIAAWAREQSSWFIFGCIRRAPEGVYNTALIINRQGELVGAYDKTHLQSHDLKYEYGRDLPVYDSDFGPFGVMICADRRWPETVRTLAIRGARIILNPTYGMHDERNLCMMRTRAFESELFIAFTHPGQALIVDPDGMVVTNEERGSLRYAITDVDLSTVKGIRVRRGHLRDRRPELYEL